MLLSSGWLARFQELVEVGARGIPPISFKRLSGRNSKGSSGLQRCVPSTHLELWTEQEVAKPSQAVQGLGFPPLDQLVSRLVGNLEGAEEPPVGEVNGGGVKAAGGLAIAPVFSLVRRLRSTDQLSQISA